MGSPENDWILLKRQIDIAGFCNKPEIKLSTKYTKEHEQNLILALHPASAKSLR
jgi:hypothetical protein